MKNILMYILLFTFGPSSYCQNSELLYKNNEFALKHLKFDSKSCIIQTIRYHDVSHSFGTFEINNDTVIFIENIDTFLLIEPLIFYNYNSKIPKGQIKLEARLSFWEGYNGEDWLHDINYRINDSITYACENVYEEYNVNHEIIIPSQPNKFELEISTLDVLRSEKLNINLVPVDYYENFKKNTSIDALYNHVVIKFKVVGSLPLPGLSLKSYAPDKILYKGKMYFFIVK